MNKSILVAFVWLFALSFGLTSCEKEAPILELEELEIIEKPTTSHAATIIETIVEGDFSSIESESYWIANNEADFELLWQNMHAHLLHIPELPTIDFSTHGVAAAFYGEQPYGHLINITNIYFDGDATFATIEKTGDEGKSSFAPTSSTSYHLVKFKK